MKQPNIVFVLIDDMGWRDLGCYGSTFYETPNIDRIAGGGMRFTNAYAACPVCSPTRASILTGRYPAALGVTDWIDWFHQIHPAKGKIIDVPYVDHVPSDIPNLATELSQMGYATWHVGKWHLGGPDYYPDRIGFDSNLAGYEAGAPYSGYFSPWGFPTLDDAEPGTNLTDHLTAKAIDLIRARDPDRPFFLNLWYYAVHTPIQAKPELVEKYTQKAQAMGLDGQEALVQGPRFACEHKKDRRIVRRVIQSDPTYAGMIETLDTNIGLLVDELESLRIADETIIVFTSDNGGLATAEGSPTCNSPLAEGKGWMYEGGTREPLIVRWPDVVRAGSTSDHVVTSPDFLPTLLDAASGPVAYGSRAGALERLDGLEGQSFLPVLRSDSDIPKREAIYWHYPHYGNQGGTPGSAVRSGNHKLIEFFEDGHLELFDIESDPGEDHNLAASLPEVRDRLHALLIAWRESVEAKIPEPNPDYEPWADRAPAGRHLTPGIEFE